MFTVSFTTFLPIVLCCCWGFRFLQLQFRIPDLRGFRRLPLIFQVHSHSYQVFWQRLYHPWLSYRGTWICGGNGPISIAGHGRFVLKQGPQSHGDSESFLIFFVFTHLGCWSLHKFTCKWFFSFMSLCCADISMVLIRLLQNYYVGTMETREYQRM